MIRGVVIAVVTSLFMVGCATVGPGSVPRDRFEYNTAVSDSWKAQTLLNIVKLRYGDMPLFMEVASIVSGYTVERTVDLEGTVFDSGSVPATATFGGSGKFVDRPTITYVPITGSEFNQNFMAPVPPSAVLFLLQAGWPASLVLPMTLEGINGLRAQRSQGLRQRAGDADFYRVIELFSILQDAGAMSMRVVGGAGPSESTVILIRRDRIAPEIQAAADELAGLLGIRSDAPQFTVNYGEIAADDTELAMLTRSTLSIMLELRAHVDVPPEDIAAGRTQATLPVPADSNRGLRMYVDIRSSVAKPQDAFVAVRYRDRWFWIDDGDYGSKRTFSFLMLLFSLTETGGKEGLPLVTIPAG
jgi:hypothetical protein